MHKYQAIVLFLVIFSFLSGAVLAEGELPVLEKGMTGSEVEKLQSLLREIGYNIEVDGHFGEETRSALQAFQTSFFLDSDGVADEETWEILQESEPFLVFEVGPGETLSQLARQFNTTVELIKQSNRLSSDLIIAGEEILVPPSWIGEGNSSILTKTIEYRVERGDTLISIASRFGVLVEEIRSKNNLKSDLILQGQKLEIPNPVGSSGLDSIDSSLSPIDPEREEDPEKITEYRVKPGDTISGIAARFGVSIEEIRSLNNLSGHLMLQGQILEIPGQKVEQERSAPSEEREKEEKTPTGTIEYRVEKGDTLSSIASRFGVSVEEIRSENELGGDFIVQGQTLEIPGQPQGSSRDDDRVSPEREEESPAATQTIEYEIRRGDTLSGIALRFNISVEEIREENNLTGDMIYRGQEIRIPNQPREIQTVDFKWPVEGGKITSPFGYRTHPVDGTRQFHSGIDIALPRGTPVKAAASGKVICSEWQTGWGRIITIDHGDDLISLYAHNDKLLIEAGTHVAQGQVIALSGNSGITTGPHLHFEIRREGDPVDPMLYLPPR